MTHVRASTFSACAALTSTWMTLQIVIKKGNLRGPWVQESVMCNFFVALYSKDPDTPSRWTDVRCLALMSGLQCPCSALTSTWTMLQIAIKADLLGYWVQESVLCYFLLLCALKALTHQTNVQLADWLSMSIKSWATGEKNHSEWLFSLIDQCMKRIVIKASK